MLLDLMLKGSESVDTVLAGQDFADLRRQAASLTSNLPKYARRCAAPTLQLPAGIEIVLTSKDMHTCSHAHVSNGASLMPNQCLRRLGIADVSQTSKASEYTSTLSGGLSVCLSVSVTV